MGPRKERKAEKALEGPRRPGRTPRLPPGSDPRGGAPGIRCAPLLGALADASSPSTAGLGRGGGGDPPRSLPKSYELRPNPHGPGGSPGGWAGLGAPARRPPTLGEAWKQERQTGAGPARRADPPRHGPKQAPGAERAPARGPAPAARCGPGRPRGSPAPSPGSSAPRGPRIALPALGAPRSPAAELTAAPMPAAASCSPAAAPAPSSAGEPRRPHPSAGPAPGLPGGRGFSVGGGLGLGARLTGHRLPGEPRAGSPAGTHRSPGAQSPACGVGWGDLQLLRQRAGLEGAAGCRWEHARPALVQTGAKVTYFILGSLSRASNSRLGNQRSRLASRWNKAWWGRAMSSRSSHSAAPHGPQKWGAVGWVLDSMVLVDPRDRRNIVQWESVCLTRSRTGFDPCLAPLKGPCVPPGGIPEPRGRSNKP